MKAADMYPEVRRNLDQYDASEVAERLEELMAYGESVVVAHPHRPPMVLLAARRYDDLVAAMAACNTLIESQRQASEPLPPL